MRDNSCEAPVLIGHHFASHGMGEHIRCSFRAFQAAGLTVSLYDIYPRDAHFDPTLVGEFGSHLVDQLSSTVNIFYINGDAVKEALLYIGNQLPPSAYNIIYPTWELSIYPQEWAAQLEDLDEIWVPSRFVFDCISKAVSKPVFHMPLATDMRLTSFRGRRYFDLPESSYLYLFYFDFNSYVDRKNPFAIIKAFEKVCSARPDADTCLVIKLNRDVNSYVANLGFPRLVEALNHCQYRDRVLIIDKVFSDNDVKNLIRCCDCFVSLHRSEGFGRGMAEAMYLAKPVVATGYGGNLDFMNETNSCLVRYELIDVQEGQYPCAKGQVWAEPDIDHAAHYMLKLLDDRDYGRRLGEVANRQIRTHFSYRAIGLRYKKRLEEAPQKTGPSMNVENA